MSIRTKAWWPPGLEPGLQQTLSVQIAATQTMDRSMYLHMLEKKLEALILGDPKAARWAMEGLFDSIAAHYYPADWAGQIVRGDALMTVLADVDWDSPPASDEPPSLREILQSIGC